MHVDPTTCCGEDMKTISAMTDIRNMKRSHSIDCFNSEIAKSDSCAENLTEKKKCRLLLPKRPVNEEAFHHQSAPVVPHIHPLPPTVLKNLQQLHQINVQQQQQILIGGKNNMQLLQQQKSKLKQQLKLQYKRQKKKKKPNALKSNLAQVQFNGTTALPMQPYPKDALLQARNQADKRKLDVANDAANYKGGDDDLEIAENPQVLIDLIAKTELDPVAPPSSSISISLDQENVDAVFPATVDISDHSNIELAILPILSEPEGVPNVLDINNESKLHSEAI